MKVDKHLEVKGPREPHNYLMHSSCLTNYIIRFPRPGLRVIPHVTSLVPNTKTCLLTSTQHLLAAAKDTLTLMYRSCQTLKTSTCLQVGHLTSPIG